MSFEAEQRKWNNMTPDDDEDEQEREKEDEDGFDGEEDNQEDDYADGSERMDEVAERREGQHGWCGHI